MGAKLLQFDILKKGLLTICVSFVCFVLILKLLLLSCFHIVSILLFVCYNLKVYLKNKRKNQRVFKKQMPTVRGNYRHLCHCLQRCEGFVI